MHIHDCPAFYRLLCLFYIEMRRFFKVGMHGRLPSSKIRSLLFEQRFAARKAYEPHFQWSCVNPLSTTRYLKLYQTDATESPRLLIGFMKRRTNAVSTFLHCKRCDSQKRDSRDVDILAVDKSGQRAMFCECKFRNKAMPMEEYDDLITASQCFSDIKEKHYCFISKSGFTEPVKERAARKGQSS